MTETPDAFILYFFHTAVSFDALWTETFLKGTSEKLFSDKSALLQTQVLADNEHGENPHLQKQHLVGSASATLSFDVTTHKH